MRRHRNANSGIQPKVVFVQECLFAGDAQWEKVLTEYLTQLNRVTVERDLLSQKCGMLAIRCSELEEQLCQRDAGNHANQA